MRRLLALLLIPALALAPGACRRQPEGSVRVAVIGGEPKLADPADGPLTPAESCLLQSAAQGLVRFDAGGNIVEQGPPAQVLDRPQHERTKQFLSRMTRH